MFCFFQATFATADDFETFSFVSIGGWWRVGSFGSVFRRIMIDLVVLGMEMMALCFAIRKHGKCLLLNLDIIAVIANYVYTNKFCFCNFIFTLLYSTLSHLHPISMHPTLFLPFIVCFLLFVFIGLI